jgi:serine/threonine-protein phosphatase 2B regulatory subunit
LSHVFQLDKDKKGKVGRKDFLSLPQMSSNCLVHRLIDIFDKDGSGDVDFREFIMLLSVFSSKGNQEDKLKCRIDVFIHELVVFRVYDMDQDGYISNGELFLVLKMMVGSNLSEQQLQQIVDKTIMESDADGDSKLSFEEFKRAVENTDIAKQMTFETEKF